MKFSRRVAVALILLFITTAFGELAPWLQHLAVGPIEGVFFRVVTLPAGPVQSRRPPRETVQELTKQLAASPNRADLLYLRANEAESNLDFAQAEQDWKAYAEGAADRMEGTVSLANYYHRRLQPKEELAALLKAAAMPGTGSELLKSSSEQQSWQLFSRALELTRAQGMSVDATESVYAAWIARYRKETDPYKNLAGFLTERHETEKAQRVIDRFANAFPTDEAFPFEARARLVSPEEAVKLYDRSFRAVMPADVVKQYFQLLNQTRGLRAYLANARAAVATNPNDVAAAARLFYYYQQAGNLAQAHRSLLEYRQRRSQPTPAELLALATLFEQTNNYVEAARSYNDLAKTSGPEAVEGLEGLIRVLFTAPEQPLPVGGGDLSFYKDIATMDPYPGALNGILSLLFNSTTPSWKYNEQERAAVPYFHRMKAAELFVEMESRFPRSQALPGLQAKLLDAYGKHGENAEVIRRGQQFLSKYSSSPVRNTVYLMNADAHARRSETAQEFAVYDALLKELATTAQNVPLGSVTDDIPAGSPETREPGPPRRPKSIRSAQYAEVLDRYVNRLVSLKRVNEVLALYRREIDRNPTDPGLYEKLAEFLNQNKMATQIEQLYTRAAAQFQDTTWNHKLARWYLRQKQSAAFEKITRQVAATFNGTELENYFQQVVANANLDAAMYRQVNLYAHQRFPHDLVFVKNLLSAYQRNGSADQIAYVALLRQHWYHDNELRSRFFSYLASTGKLDAEIASLRSMPAETLRDRAATELIAGAEIWRSHFENAAPLMQTLAADYPAHRELNATASSLYRSLGQSDEAAKIADRLARSEPRDRQALALAGEIYADREQFDKARVYWDRITSIEAGKPEGYLEAATVYWDYFRYDDALRVIREGQANLRDDSAFAYEAGAIHENKRQYAEAVGEYLKGAQADPDSPSRRRLVRLAARPAHRDEIEAQTRSIASGASPDLKAWNLRVALLEEQNRRNDVAALLSETTSSSNNFELLTRVEQVAERNGFAQLKEQALAREAVITPDPIERIRLSLQVARLAEERKDLQSARSVVEAVYKDNSSLAGVVRSTVDYHWRTGDRKRAVDVLEEAASRSNAGFRRQFSLEASRKATEAGDYRRAREFLSPMLSVEPLASDLVAAMAETYSRAGDDVGLKSFYNDRLKLTRTPDQQASLRRGLIPVLTRAKDYAGAVDEYIAIVNRFPEDEAFISEAARYARKHNVVDRLTAFYTKAMADSPKDSRWPVVMARMQTSLENLPAAAESYTKALAIRPDRSDLLAARAGLEERLLRFKEAAASNAKLYELAYKDPQYMVKVAENRARLGQKEPAIDALRLAFLEGKSAKASAYLEIAMKLDQWNFLPEARQYIGEARKLEPESGKSLEARILTRMRQYSALDSEEGISTAAQVAQEYFTPEEKIAFGTWLMRTSVQDKARYALFAGLQDVAVRDLEARIKAAPSVALADEGRRLIQIQQQRLRNGDLAVQLETFWKALPKSPDQTGDELLAQAAENWRLNGNAKEELRIRELQARHGVSTNPTRYAELLFRASPDRLAQTAATGSDNIRDEAFAAAFSSPDASTALKAISIKGANRPPRWTKAYTALTAIHFNLHNADVENAFIGLLGPRTIGEQVAAKANRDQQVVGDEWFYYGSRYGEWAKSEDFLPSEVEGRPASANPYVALGDHYRDQKQFDRSMDEYARALQLDAKAALVYNRMAEILRAQGKTAEAQTHWKEAIGLFAEMQDRRVPEEFWDGLASTIRGAGQALRPDLDRLLRTYVRRNGTYRFEPILGAIRDTSASPTESAKWISDISTSAVEPSQFLAAIAADANLEPAAREILYARLLELARQEAERRAGDSRNDAEWRYRDYQIRYIRLLIDEKRNTRASELLKALPHEMREQLRYAVVPLEIENAAAMNQLDEILRRDDIDNDFLKNAAAQLKAKGDAASARRVLEAFYSRELDRGNLDLSNFIGLAEVRLEQNDVPGAVAQLRRLTIVSTEHWEALTAAADLLTKFKRPAEAEPFWEARVKVVPWDHDAQVQLAKVRNDTATLTKLASDNTAPYQRRVAAAKQLKGVIGLGATELDLLASTTPLTQAAVEKPYQYHARVREAEETNDQAVRARLLRGAIAIDSTPSDVRLKLFRTHFQANQYDQAIAVYRFNSLLDDNSPVVIRDMGTAYRKLGDFAAARMQFERAGRLDPTLDTRGEIASIDAELKRLNENRRRMPRVHDNLDQTERVRPRI